MTVAAYREWIDGLVYALTSFKSAATPDERVKEARRVRHNIKCVRRANCPRAKQADRGRAGRWIDAASAAIEVAGLTETLDRMEQADAALARLAFGAEYR